MDNLQEMDRFLEKFNLPRLIQKEIKNSYKPTKKFMKERKMVENMGSGTLQK